MKEWEKSYEFGFWFYSYRLVVVERRLRYFREMFDSSLEVYRIAMEGNGGTVVFRVLNE